VNNDERCVLFGLRIHSSLSDMEHYHISCHGNNEIALHEGLCKYMLRMA